MNAPLYLLNLASVLAVFCAVAWQLLLTLRQGHCRRSHSLWMVRGLSLIGIAVGMLAVWLRDLAGHDYAAPWFVVMARLCVAAYLISQPGCRQEAAR